MKNQTFYNRTLKYSARELRNNPTKFEKILWNFYPPSLSKEGGGFASGWID